METAMNYLPRSGMRELDPRVFIVIFWGIGQAYFCRAWHKSFELRGILFISKGSNSVL